MGTLLHPSKHTKTVNGPWVRASVGKQSGWESGWLPPVITTGKRPRLPPCFAQITGPLLDTGPKQRRPCLLLITLHSLSVCEFWFLLSSANRYLSISVRLSIHPSILSLPCAAYITLRTQDWLIRETLYKGSSQRGTWLDKTLEGNYTPTSGAAFLFQTGVCVSLLVAPAGVESSTQERSELLDKLR